MIIQRIWSGQPGKFFCLSTKSASKVWKDHFFTKSDFRKIPQFLAEHSDKDLYFCPHGFTAPRRKKEVAVLPKLFWSDMDEVDPRTVTPKPTIAFESSPGRYVGLWVTDRTVTEEQNKQLSYKIGADKSGWDLTQVLRVPGTTNYKYTSQPKTRILWSDGDSVVIDQLKLPRIKGREDRNDEGIETDASELFKKYERRIPRWLRRELINGRPTPGKRSEMIWKIEQTLIEKGFTTDEVLTLVKASPWNKFAGRRDEDEQLRRELDKSINKKMSAKRVESRDDEEDGDRKLIFKPMSEVEEEEIDWLWYPYMALGELTILEGDPGLGKSYLMQMIAGHVCDGREMPSIKKLPPVEGRVVYFDMENSSGTVTKKRLTGNGIKRLDRFVQCEEPFSIDDDDSIDEIYEYFEAHKPTVVVFDTINTYLGKADAFKGHEAQQAFSRFRELASRFHCSVVVLRHLTKSGKERALYRGQGNISFAGLARSVITCGRLPDDPEVRVMAITKLNIGKFPPALTFTIEALPDTLKHSDRSKFEFGEFVDLTADDIVMAAPAKDESKSDEEARRFLEETVKDEVEASRVERLAEARSIPKAALKRAMSSLGFERQARGFGEKKKVWIVAPEKAPTVKGNRTAH